MKTTFSFITCFFISAILLAAPPLLPGRLTCEYLQNPLGIDMRQPRFSWTLVGNERNQLQSAYEILVSDDEKQLASNKGNCWSSGKIISNQATHILYQGKPLRSFTRYYWRINVYNQEGVASGWSKTAWFETAMLEQTDWQARWIGDGSRQPDRDEDHYLPDRMPLFKTVFAASKKIRNARLYISGLGYYEAWLNGKRVGDHVLDPGFTTYRKEVQYAVYDITGLMKPGKNTAGIQLGNGWWNPLPFKFFGRWDLRNYQQTGRPCVKAELHILYADSSVQKIITDENWLSAPGPITQNNIYLGERYDARLEEDWASVGPQWKKAVLVNGPAGKLSPQLQPAIKVTKELAAVSIRENGKDTFIVDMGQNFAGSVRIHVSGSAGTEVRLRYGEALFKDGSLNYMTTVATQIKKGGISGGPGASATAWQEDRYILKGAGRESWSPRFTFHGFRYVEITGWPGKPAIADIQGLRMNSDLQPNGDFACSNDMFNQLYETIDPTFLSNVFSVQSDCPGREKMGYGGDMVATANSFIYNYDMANFYRKTIQDFANEQRPLGGITEIAPFTGIADRGYGDDSGPLGWQLAFPFLQKQLYDFYGDRQVIETYYPAFKKQLAFLQSKAVDGMFYWDISDHEALDAKPEALTASCFYYHHLQLAAEFAGILRVTDDSLNFAKQAERLKKAIIQKYLVRGTGRFDNGTQSAQLFALWYGLSPEKEKSQRWLLKEFERHDWHISTGIFSTKMLFDVLRENDLNEVAYRLASQTSYPGWGYMLQQGATTLWETWQYPETSPSQNHPMFGSVNEWFYRSLLGINPGSAGFETIIIKPQPAGDLSWAKGSYQSVRGPIRSEWKKDAGNFVLKVSIPANTRATVWLPAVTGASVTEANKPITGLRKEAGYLVADIGSGDYTFEVR